MLSRLIVCTSLPAPLSHVVAVSVPAVAGLVDTNEGRNISGLAGLSEIRFLSPLVSTHEHDTSRDEVILLMRPRLLTVPPGEHVPRVISVGTETRPATIF